MPAPVKYIPGFISDPGGIFAELLTLDWERRSDAPRCEYYCNDRQVPYVYGQGRGRRLYEPRPYSPAILTVREALEALSKVRFEVCFLNRYLDQSDHLGWHSDDSPEMDDDRPIGIVSFGVEREICFRKKPESLTDAAEDRRDGGDRRWILRRTEGRRTEGLPEEKVMLANGSLCLMEPHMQESWQHKIPKASFKCGERISLTFRGYVAGAEPCLQGHSGR